MIILQILVQRDKTGQKEKDCKKQLASMLLNVQCETCSALMCLYKVQNLFKPNT